jgi:hypothetical protein
VLSMMQRRAASLAATMPDCNALFSTWIDGYRPKQHPAGPNH